MPARVFISYAHADEAYRNQLDKQLAILKRAGIVETWHDRRLVPGEEWDHGIRAELDAAQIILLLVSADFLTSDYVHDVEITRAMERHHAGSARVIPVILRSCAWDLAPFAKLQALPKDGKPIDKWANIDEAFLDVTNGIRGVADTFGKKSMPAPAAATTARPSAPPASAGPRSGNLRITMAVLGPGQRCVQARRLRLHPASHRGLARRAGRQIQRHPRKFPVDRRQPLHRRHLSRRQKGLGLHRVDGRHARRHPVLQHRERFRQQLQRVALGGG